MSANLTLAVMTIMVVAMLNYIGSGGKRSGILLDLQLSSIVIVILARICHCYSTLPGATFAWQSGWLQLIGRIISASKHGPRAVLVRTFRG